MVHRLAPHPLASSRFSEAPPVSPAAFRCGGAAAACLALGIIALAAAPLGPLARHMGSHLLLMNAVAPFVALAAIAAAGRTLPTLASTRSLMGATLVQIVLLWAWHVPAALAVAARVPAIHAVMQSSFLAAALWFWLAVLSDRSTMRWRALFALLITGKLFCLLGALLVFAPRLLYGDVAAHGVHIVDAAGALADQHLAGLLMLAVCPLTYVLAGVVIAAHWLRDLARAAPGGIPADRDVMAAQ
jgi:putative membrane protein